MQSQIYYTYSERDTMRFASLFGKHLHEIDISVKFILNGDLGSGKTCFVRGLVQEFYPKAIVSSATYVIAKSFGYKPIIYHLDLYRIKKNHNLEDLGILEIMNDSKALICVEWPVLSMKFQPRSIKLSFSNTANDKNIRLINLSFSDDFPKDWVLTVERDLSIFKSKDRGVEQSGSSSGS